ncbi:Similar to S.cerevisiae protein ZIM17 (Protein co-chaperone with a zinc finger motif) [Malassezia sympodialis ATCC 42132]|uniref:Similar to S.cerevisiae protein ZIM17 (Protein co-chaperone with a zinc finger motif) n=1 Tax=Malassezia sympodialis (strain ATCC 42132) TaxID=1230383 RepID=A0A1M8A7Q8_MALS4|nr:Similar to S.cerevisiae protein ZIM17 (Protein co-chaperone with a zinc finger motif) [Malassezia sympodialis ATCC 42132]
MRVHRGLAVACAAVRSGAYQVPRPGVAHAIRSLPPFAVRPFHASVLRREAPQTPEGEVQPRLQLTFTCTVPSCHTRSSHEFSKRSYTHGIVIVECPGCKNRHLIADNLGWFTDSKDEPRTVEEIVRAKGGRVQVGTMYADGSGGETIEIESGED